MIEKCILEIKARDKTISKRDEDDWKAKKHSMFLYAQIKAANVSSALNSMSLKSTDWLDGHLVIKVKILWTLIHLRNNHDCFFVKLNIMYAM